MEREHAIHALSTITSLHIPTMIVSRVVRAAKLIPRARMLIIFVSESPGISTRIHPPMIVNLVPRGLTKPLQQTWKLIWRVLQVQRPSPRPMMSSVIVSVTWVTQALGELHVLPVNRENTRLSRALTPALHAQRDPQAF